MLAYFPATSSPETILDNPFPVFEPVFNTTWNCHDLICNNVQSPKSVSPISELDEANQVSVNSNSGSGSSDDPTHAAEATNDRKRRRMISNRESARRSRMRKQKHLENLRNQANRFKVMNRELSNRLGVVLYHGQLVRAENDHLWSDCVMLRHRLSEIQHILLLRQLGTSALASSPLMIDDQRTNMIIT